MSRLSHSRYPFLRMEVLRKDVIKLLDTSTETLLTREPGYTSCVNNLASSRYTIGEHLARAL